MPVYNGEQYLNDAIQSVLNQSYPNFELVIINDGSTDRTEEIIQAIRDPRIRYYRNQTNLKLIKTLNFAITVCSGEYIARMDADDICAPTRFEQQIAYMTKHPDCGVCGSWARIIDAQNQKTGRIKNPVSNPVIRASLLFTPAILHPSVMVRADILKKFQYNQNALHTEDFDLWIKIAKDPEVEFHNLPEFLLDYRWHYSNISAVNDNFQYEKKKELLRQELQKLLNTHDIDLDLHLATFNLYRFDQKIKSSYSGPAIRGWLEKLALANRQLKQYNPFIFESFLLSRWIVYCIHTKKLHNILSINFIHFNYFKLVKAMSILLSK
ncbi:glycosyl transferase family 2 [Mangrovibacterium marinum]|uniref:Glycosyl transferase family 2 n=1 Tax=Mangrovibacterium marinum TaxID=1639118 RepID=A0A2T5C6A4_9BACT|nr:glycosyltransferase family 2 protein [Mangrovibacterium marinum]PTN10481.1 glycosyl transferase family 2 [Mangrovibacterium marinum]